MAFWRIRVGQQYVGSSIKGFPSLIDCPEFCATFEVGDDIAATIARRMDGIVELVQYDLVYGRQHNVTITEEEV